ncbi:hypothetical protein [Roseisolibacter agri]|uniref:Uncharacterized protein n=1 Tax=Roseisolibacter agri TaxID=2014610 RepID=A0AA37QA11_9BACT|nr:hypothetical protein [Roseisolibacter agri]GLC25101.1 hypothetical protein rosag_16140 [Roseisolibacter agri]
MITDLAPEPATPAAEPPTARPRTVWPSLRIRIDWRYAVGQVCLTALGVLLALAGSAWWTDRQERIRERSELRNLLDAARVNERRLQQAVHEDSVALKINLRLRDSLATVSDDSLPILVDDAGWWSDAQPMVTPFAALIQNGDIHLVRDSRLRALLPTYVGEIETRTRNVDALNQARVAFGAKEPSLIAPDYGAPARVRGAVLRSRPGLHDAMRAMWFFNLNTTAHYRIMLRATTELRQELERVLGERPVPLSAPRINRDSFMSGRETRR